MSNLRNSLKEYKNGLDTCYYCDKFLWDPNLDFDIDFGGSLHLYKLSNQNNRIVYVCGHCHEKIKQRKLKKMF